MKILLSESVLSAISMDIQTIQLQLMQRANTVTLQGVDNELSPFTAIFVTLNPAKLLRLDDQVGSLKVGKDADIVLWSGHPMSLYTQTEQTYIEGALYFDKYQHKEKLNDIKEEKNKLIQQMLGQNLPGANLMFPNPMPQIEITCEYTEF